MTDPFSLVFNELWCMAEERPELVSLVRLGNRIKYNTTDRDPEKRNYSDADLPELSLLSTGFTGNMCNTSNTSMLSMQYAWHILTGDMRITERLLPVEWALFLAMHKWRERLGALTWQDKSFVKSANLMPAQEGVFRPGPDRQSGPQGWAAVWAIQVDMYFALTDIQQEAVCL